MSEYGDDDAGNGPYVFFFFGPPPCAFALPLVLLPSPSSLALLLDCDAATDS